MLSRLFFLILLRFLLLAKPACHLFEKLGYRRTGEAQRVRPNMTIVDYEKE